MGKAVELLCFAAFRDHLVDRVNDEVVHGVHIVGDVVGDVVLVGNPTVFKLSIEIRDLLQFSVHVIKLTVCGVQKVTFEIVSRAFIH